jgi:hypothetical protein
VAEGTKAKAPFYVLCHHSTVHYNALPPIIAQDIRDKMISRFRSYLWNQLQLGQPNHVRAHRTVQSMSGMSIASSVTKASKERDVFGKVDLDLGQDDDAHDPDVGHNDSCQDDSCHDDSGHDDSGHDYSGHDDSGHDDSGHDDWGHDDPCHDDSHESHDLGAVGEAWLLWDMGIVNT